LKLIDIILLVIILIGAFQGFKSGFVVELFSLLGVFLGVLGGFKLMGVAMVMLNSRFNIDEKVLPYVAFAVVFVVIVIVVGLLGRMIKASFNQTLLGGADQIAGAVLGIVRSAFMLSIMIWIADALHFKALDQWAEDSLFYPTFASFAPKITDWVGELIPFFRDVL
jgi:membrane protein required for colicin V production